MPSVATLYVRLKADTRDYHRKLDRAMKGMRKFSKRTAAMGTQMSMKLSLPLMLAAGAMTKFSVDMNKGMADVATLIPGNIARVEELKASVQRLAIETGKSTTDMAAGLYQVVSAFGDSAESAKRLEIVAKAAAAGGATTTDALNLLSAMTKGYGDTSAKAMENAADLAFQIVKLGQTTFPELAASMGRSIPLAASLGVEIEELAAGYATLTGVTGSASEVSSQLSAMIRAMIKQTPEMAKAIGDKKDGLGYATAAAMIKAEGLVGALRKLIGTTDGTQEAITKLFGRAEALVAVFALTEGQMITFDEKMMKMMETGGSMREAFREQTQGINRFGHALNVLKIRLLVLAQRIGDRLAPAFETILSALEPVLVAIERGVEWFEKLDEKWQIVIIAVGALVAALGPLLLGFALLAKATVVAVGIIGALTSPIGLVVIGIAALAAAFLVYKDEIIGYFQGLYEGAKKFFVVKMGSVWKWLGEALTKVVGAFKWVYDQVTKMLSYVGVNLPELVEGARDLAVGFAEALPEFAAHTASAVGDIFKAQIEQFQAWWAELQAGVKKAGQDTNDAVGESTNQMNGIVKKHFEETTETGKTMFETLKEAGDDWTTNFEDSIVEFVKTAKFEFHELAEAIIEDLIRINVEAARGGLWKFLSGVAASVAGGGGGGGVTGGGSGNNWIPGGPISEPFGLSAGGPAVVVNDNRGADAPPVQVSQSRSGAIVVTITDAVIAGGYGGQLDKMMAENFGVSRQAIGR